MNRRLIMAVVVLLVLLYFVWGQAGRSMADAERFFTVQIMNKLDEVVKNQQSILSELGALKKEVSALKKSENKR